MTLLDLFFLGSVLLVVVLLLRSAWLAIRGRWSGFRRCVRMLAVFVVCYATALLAAATLMPRRFISPGERRCFDDWCITAVAARPVQNSGCTDRPGERVWIATLEVSSEARRVRQRAPDATAELEDNSARRYQPCAAPLADGNSPPRLLSDELDPGNSFAVLLPFRLPADAQPAGVVVHHGAFPGVIIIGDDQSFLHAPALLRIRVE